MNSKINSILSVLALMLALVFALPPLAHAQESPQAAAESSGPTPKWACRSIGKSGDYHLMCRAVCGAGDSAHLATGPSGDYVVRWQCPNSNARKKCSAYDCASVSECAEKGVTDYALCHGNDETACARQAQAATSARCAPEN